MWQAFREFIQGAFFRGALPEAVFWGRIALGVGVVGFLASTVLVLLHLRDEFSLRRNEHRAKDYRPPKWGPLSQSLKEFFVDPARNAPLSPDAAAEYVIGRLEATRDAASSAIRYFSYSPLLFGLMGTIFALRSLLVTQGNTLQQIQPHLAGVFAGTLAGIVGSLFASAGGVLLDSASLSAANRAQDFIHRYILPMLPERRIAVHIEEAVLTIIGEKAQAVAQSFSKTMQPVAAQMEQVADRCGKAAETAMKSLTEAARAVRDAGNLENASHDFKKGAHMIDSAAEQLSDATKQTAEVILRVGEIRQSLNELLSRVGETSQNLAGTTERIAGELASRIVELNSYSESLGAAARTLYPAIEGLSSELVRRATSDSAHLEVIRGHIESTSRGFSDVKSVLSESASHLQAIPTRLEQIAASISDGTRQGVAAAMDQVAREILKRLGDVVTGLENSTAVLSKTVTASATQDGNRGTTSLDFVKDTREMMLEMRSASDELRKIATVLQQINSVQGDASSKKSDGFFRRWWDR